MVSGSGVCRKVPLMAQSVDLTNEFIVLEPGAVDVILGVQWLRTLGKCEVDWEELTLSFWLNNTKWTLQGDPSITGKVSEREMVSVVLELQALETLNKKDGKLHPEIEAVLEEFAGVFEEPK